MSRRGAPVWASAFTQIIFEELALSRTWVTASPRRFTGMPHLFSSSTLTPLMPGSSGTPS